MRTFDDKPAVRESVPLLIGLFGPSGGGKTWSALELATGIQSVTGGDIYCIDTEAKRALNYADHFKFRHLPFGAPFGPLDYLAAVDHCVKKGAGVIIIDSQSHEHEGPGGVLEMHDAELARLGGDMKNNFRAWGKPKADRRRYLNSLLQMPVNFVFCFRAKEKMKLPPAGEKQNPIELGWMPIAGEEFIYEMTASCLLPPKANGVPCWQSDFPGERMQMKLPEQFKAFFANRNEPLSRKVGEQMAAWARGGVPAPKADPAPSVPLADLPAAWADWSNEERGDNRASLGTAHLVAWWKTLAVHESKSLTAKKDADWKPTAAKVDASKQPAA